MTENKRTETARDHDDSGRIEGMEDAPSHGDRSGHRIGRDIGTQDELKQAVGEGGVTRARDADEKNEADMPRYDER